MINADALALHSEHSGTRLVELRSNSLPRQVPVFCKGLLMVMLSVYYTRAEKFAYDYVICMLIQISKINSDR